MREKRYEQAEALLKDALARKVEEERFLLKLAVIVFLVPLAAQSAHVSIVSGLVESGGGGCR